MKHGLAWYLRRARMMSPAEIPHRVAELVRVRALERRGHSAPPPAAADRVAFFQSASPVLTLPWTPSETAGGLLDGAWPALAWEWRFTGGDDDWRRAPDTGRMWPMPPASRVPYRPGNAFGDARVVWEPARLQQLVALALRADGRAAALAEAQLLSFWRLNPPYLGVHYLSAMECALRLIAVAHAYDLLRGRLADERAVRAAVLGIVGSHAELIRRKLSLHSSAGNHTIAECVGLVYAGALFPELPHAAGGLRRGASLLAREADRQVRADGGGVEQATWYLRFVADLLELGGAVLAPHRPAEARVATGAAERARGFLRALGGATGALPRIGDSDDGYALVHHRPAPGGELAGVTPLDASGYTVVRTGPAHLVMDHGPLGMAPAYGHGHADALAVLLRWGGHDVVVDTGTETYTGDPVWRRYFRSTRAHNTVLVNEDDQAVMEAAFMWSRPFGARLLGRGTSADGGVTVAASHDGYRRHGVLHARAVRVAPDGSVVVVDRLHGEARGAQLRWHTPHAVTLDGRRVQWHGLDVPLTAVVAGGDLRVLRAEAADGGWIAPRYGVRAAANTVVAESAGRDIEFVTTFSADGRAATAEELDELRRLCERG